MFAAIEPNLTRVNAMPITEEICTVLRRLHVPFAFSERVRAAGECCRGDILEDGCLYKKCDIVIAVGGDGSIIRSAKYAAEYGKPVLGINAGKVAFMAGLESNELHLLSALIDGKYSVDERMMLTADIERDGQILHTAHCLNDAVFARGGEIYLTEAAVECDGVPVNTYRSDGIVLSTPTGSTAYSFAAGGPVAEPTLECMILTPISPYSMSSRCIIFSADSHIQVRPCDPNRPLYFSADGGRSVRIPEDGQVSVRKCEHYAGFIRIKNERFWNVLDNKIEK